MANWVASFEWWKLLLLKMNFELYGLYSTQYIGNCCDLIQGSGISHFFDYQRVSSFGKQNTSHVLPTVCLCLTVLCIQIVLSWRQNMISGWTGLLNQSIEPKHNIVGCKAQWISLPSHLFCWLNSLCWWISSHVQPYLGWPMFGLTADGYFCWISRHFLGLHPFLLIKQIEL